MFAPYESIELFKWVISQKEIIISKDWFNIIKEWDINKLYLKAYPNNCIVDKIKDFKVINKSWKKIVLKIFTQENSFFFLDIKDIKKEKVQKTKCIRKDNEWLYENIEKEKTTIYYFIYKDNEIEKCDSTYIKWESNIIWKSIWPYQEDELYIKEKYFPKPSIKNQFFKLFKKK